MVKILSIFVAFLENMNFKLHMINQSIYNFSNMSCLEAHAGFFRLLLKGIFDPYALGHFDKKLICILINK
jgi:hypothetical protein